MPLFTALIDKSKAISRETFNKEFNAVLSIAEDIFGKHIQTHFLTISLPTDLLTNYVPLDDVQQIARHKAIATTQKYRQSLSHKIEDIKKIIALADEPLKIQRLKRKKKSKELAISKNVKK